MKNSIPFMTDDEIMELLSKNMNVFFDDYEEIKTNYLDTLKKMKNELGDEKYETVEKLIAAHKSQVASDMVFAYSCGYKHNLAHFKNPVERIFLEVDPTHYTHENLMLRMPKRTAAEELITNIHKEFEHLDYDTYFLPFLDFFNCYSTIAPKYAHYVGYLDANEILPLTEAGYCEDHILTSLYHKHIKELIGINDLETNIQETQ